MIVASDQYEQETLPHLLARVADVEALGRVLGDPQIGGFAVQMVHNEPAHVIYARVEDLVSECRPQDVLLLYFSCCGLQPVPGELFFAASNTRPNRLGSTAVSADFVQRCMMASLSRSIVLLLDYFYIDESGRERKISGTEDVQAAGAYLSGEPPDGRGRAVITAVNTVDHLQPSLFTAALVKGLATGDADLDEDGWVSLGELYDYLVDKIREQDPTHIPGRQVRGQLQMQQLHVARSPRWPMPADPPLPGRIFISYRRGDSAYPAGWLFDRLAEQFGQRQIFKDVDSIQLGDDFVDMITATVGSCDVLLVIIGDRWLAMTGEDGQRRLDDPNDFVRLEVEAGLARKILIIPILVNGARMPRVDQLPPSLAPLAHRQALELTPSRFRSDTRHLLKVLDKTLTEAQNRYMGGPGQSN